MPTQQTFITKFLLLIGLAIALPAITALGESDNGDDAFRKAVQAVKLRDYSKALTLFEKQADDAKHDAQYNMAVLLQAGKGRPQNYPEALYWSWLAQLGGIEEAEDIASDMLDALTEDDAKAARTKVEKTLQDRLDKGDIQAISQFANYHLSISEEPDYGTAYVWYSIAAALNIPEMAEQRDKTEKNIEAKELAGLQSKAKELFDKYDFSSFDPNNGGNVNDS